MGRAGETVDSLNSIQTDLVGRLRQRFSEIHEAIFLRVRALSDERVFRNDPAYLAGLHTTAMETIEYALRGIEHGPDWSEPIPEAAIAQARRAARLNVRLDMVLRRYAAGDRLLGEFIMEESGRLPNNTLRQVLNTQGVHVDRLMADVATEYMNERERMKHSPVLQVGEYVQALLAGDNSAADRDFGYELGNWHQGIVAAGPLAEQAVRSLASYSNHEVLVVPRQSNVVWSWLGASRPSGVAGLENLISNKNFQGVSIAIGEPRKGVDGWRLTHREAQAAFEVMFKRPQRFTRSRDVLLLAAVLRDEAIAHSLLQTYIKPLDDLAISGDELRKTLKAYCATGFNTMSAAALLQVDRRTIQRRLRKAEEAIGRSIPKCHVELGVALGVDELNSSDRVVRNCSE